ncbi:cytochrome P450 [Rickenella mellea]|uniref:Cytochrome P450 n=1 Tax=Rickenella mellea TaxID=50990 RepID=A0A4Y7Q112_9AGAM|nr:cytochrome P450 [Rickenella mellea]
MDPSELFYTSLSAFTTRHLLVFGSIFILFRLSRQILWPYVFSPLRVIPGPPIIHPILGQFPTLLHGVCGFLKRSWSSRYGSVVRFVGPFGVERVMFLSPQALHKILVSDWQEYPKPDFVRNILGVSAGWGLLTETGDVHRQMRRNLNPAFSITSLAERERHNSSFLLRCTFHLAETDMYYEPTYGLVEILNEGIEAEPTPSLGKVFYTYEWLSKATLDIICLAAFGYRTDALHNPDNELADAYHNLVNTQSLLNLAIFSFFMSIPGVVLMMKSKWMTAHLYLLKKITLLAPIATLFESVDRIKRISAEMLREKMSDTDVAASDADSKRDILSRLVRMRMSNAGKGDQLSDETMMEQVITFLGAGHETTATGLAWTLWLLASHPDIQAKLRAEVGHMVEHNPRPDFRTLKQMEYLDSVVMESLRIMPPVPMTLRRCAKDDYIDNVWIPKGTMLYIAIRVVNTFKEVWGDDAEQFRPERWAELPKKYNPTFSLLSFLAGPHSCIGRTMAIAEMKAVLSILITNFEFEPAYVGQIIRPTAAITMKPADNLPLRIRLVRQAPS